MPCLVLLDHENGKIKQPSRSAVTAARKLGEVHVLTAGHNVGEAAQAASRLEGVSKVHVADGPEYEHALAEPLAALLASVDGHHDHLLAAATAIGKNLLPRIAALLDSQPISDISSVVDANIFVHRSMPVTRWPRWSPPTPRRSSPSAPPRFQVADYGLVGDLFQVLPELDAALASTGGF